MGTGTFHGLVALASEMGIVLFFVALFDNISTVEKERSAGYGKIRFPSYFLLHFAMLFLRCLWYE